MDKGFFDGITPTQAVLSNGVKFDLPVRYYDWSSIMAHFPTPVSTVRSLLPSRRLKPALIRPGMAVISIAAMEYKDIGEIDPYNEVSIMVPVLYEPLVNIPMIPLLFPQWFRRFGLYVHHLPLTSEMGRIGGIELWGYPKFLADITFDDLDGRRRCSMSAEGKHILTLDVQTVATKPKRLDYYTYTVKEGQLLRTRIQTQGEYGNSRRKGGASLTLGDHPVAQELSALHLGEHAMEISYATRIQSMLHAAGESLPV